MENLRTLAACMLLCASSATSALPSTAGIVEVRDARDPFSKAPSLGFIADAQGHVFASVPEDADALLVRLSDGTEYRADSVYVDAHTGLGLLALKIAIPSATLTSYVWAPEAIVVERKVYGVSKDSKAGTLAFTSGSVARIVASDTPADPDVIWHNVLVGQRLNGSPLMNNCGEVGGIIVGSPDSGDSLAPSGMGEDREKGSGRAVPSEWLVKVFGQYGFKPEFSAQPCLSESALLQKAEDKVEQSEAERQKAEERAREAQEKAKAADEAREKAERGSKEEVAAAAQAREEAEKKAKAEEEARKEAEAMASQVREETEKWTWVAGIGLALLLLLIWAVYRQSVNRANQAKVLAERKEEKAKDELAGRKEQEERMRELPDVVLNGEDTSGERFVLRIPKHSLTEGAVVGRSPGQSEFIINHGEVSRRHFRLFLQDDIVMVEDMRSTNGTEVDGVRLAPGDSAEIRDGTQLRLGNLSLAVRLE